MANKTLSDKRECVNDCHFHAKKCPDSNCINIYHENDITDSLNKFKESLKDLYFLNEHGRKEEICNKINIYFGDALVSGDEQ